MPSPTLPSEERKAEPDRARSRSRSPRRSPLRKPKNYSGLKWKNDKKEDRGGDSRRRDDRDRDYDRRERDDRRGGDRSDRRDRDRRDDRGDRRRDDRYSDRRGDPRDERRGDERRDSNRRRDDRDRKPRESKEKKAAPAAAIPTSNEPLILVNVNDRLGTKTQIPCLASDKIGVFKVMVAAQIGRPVHEIMLKRQGERPFLDTLQLADYSISNGVQIDLELNTGD